MSINPDLLKKQGQISHSLNQPVEISLAQELQAHKELLLKIYADTRKTRRYIMLGKIISFIYLILIVAPLVLAAIYLPPLLKNVIEPYKELLSTPSVQTGTNLHQIDMGKAKQLLKEVK